MGNRRLGRKRLFSLEKKGQENPNRPAAGIAPAVVYSKISSSPQKKFMKLGSNKLCSACILSKSKQQKFSRLQHFRP